MNARRKAPRLVPRAQGPWLVGMCVLLACLFGSRTSLAVDRRTDAAAAQALVLAAKDHAAGDDDGALLRLEKARRACGASRCADRTKASLLRDIGAIELARSERARASASIAEALDLAPDLAWNPAYTADDALAEWAAMKDERAARQESPPEGDLAHVPESEQVVGTPLPIYAETSLTGVARVVVKFRAPGSSELTALSLKRMGGGWGGTLPCSAMRRGVVRYFIQAFDADGTPLGNSGDVRHLYVVPIRWGLVGDPPHLPGRPPPAACHGTDDVEEAPSEIAVHGPSVAAEASFVRLWVGFAASVDLTTMSSGTNQCALSSGGTPVDTTYYCTNPDGSDFPARTAAAVTQSTSGQTSGGPVTGDVRLLATLDYAFSVHFLSGLRLGYVDQSYPGTFAGHDGHGAPIPIHVEARETYLFGQSPLARSGFAPYAFVSAGYAKTDASAIAPADVVGVAGTRPVIVWRIGGPFFVAAGGGARYAFSPRVAFLAGVKAALPFGSGGVVPSLAPEVSLQYGF